MKKAKKAVIYGAGAIAEVAWYYLTHDSFYEVCGFIDDSIQKEERLFDLPIYYSDDIERVFPPSDYDAFVAIGYSQMNCRRENCIELLKKKGYLLLNYVSSHALIFTNLNLRERENLFILENNVLQPFVEIGNGVFIWSGNHIGHHSKIKDYCFISSHVVISGACTIESHSFLGVNSTITEGINIGSKSLIGAGTFIKKNVEPESVYYAEGASKSTKNSLFFMK